MGNGVDAFMCVLGFLPKEGKNEGLETEPRVQKRAMDCSFGKFLSVEDNTTNEWEGSNGLKGHHVSARRQIPPVRVERKAGNASCIAFL